MLENRAATGFVKAILKGMITLFYDVLTQALRRLNFSEPQEEMTAVQQVGEFYFRD